MERAKTERRPWYHFHFSSFLILLAATTVPLVLNLQYEHVDRPLWIDVYFTHWETQSHARRSGWPLTFHEIQIDSQLDQTVVHRSAWALAGDLLVAVIFVLVTTGLYEYRRRHRERLLQITLSDVMIAMLTACMALACWRGLVVQHAARQEIIDEIRNQGGRVTLSIPFPSMLRAYEDRSPQISTWCYRLREAFSFLEQPTIVVVGHNDPQFWPSLRLLRSTRVLSIYYGAPPPQIFTTFPNLERLTLSSIEITDDIAEPISRIASLRWLQLVETSVTDEGIARIARRLPLRVLDLTGTKITDAGLAEIAGISQLHELGLSDTQVTAAGFQHLHGHPSLTRLRCEKGLKTAAGEFVKLKNMTRLEEVYLGAVPRLHLENLPRLRELPSKREPMFGTIFYGSTHADRSLTVEELVLRNLPALTAVNLRSTLRRLEASNTNALSSFAMGMPYERRDARDYPVDDAIAGAIGGVPSLESLQLPGARLTPVGWSNLARLPNLTFLDLTRTNIQDADLVHAAHLNKLESLSLAHTEIGNEGWKCLPDMPQLNRLSLKETQITHFTLADHSKLTKLNVLGAPIRVLRLVNLPELSGMFQLGGQHIDVLEMKDLPKLGYLSFKYATVDSAQLRGLTGLNRLTLSQSNATDSWLSDVGACRQLKQIQLRATSISDASLAQIGRLEQVTRLDLEGTAVSDHGLADLAKMATIEILNLTGTAVTDEGLVHLANFQNLELLYLGRTHVHGPGLVHLQKLPSLRKLSLGVTGVDSRSLAALSSITTLQWLRLSDTRIDDRAFVHLQPLNRLNTLLLNGTRITDAGFAKSVLPGTLRYLDLQDTGVTQATASEWRDTHRARINVVTGPSERKRSGQK